MSKKREIRPEVLNFRESVQTVVGLLAAKKIRVVDFGNEAYCAYNKKTGELEYINIPSIPDTASDDLLTAIRGFIDHEVAHVLFTDISISKLMEGKTAHSLWNVVEDTFIERKMGNLFLGSRKHLLQTQKHLIDSFFNIKIQEFIDHFGDNTKDLFLAAFFMPVSRAYCGHTPFIDFMESHWWRFDEQISILESINYKERINRITKSEGAAKLAIDVIKAFRLAEEKKKEELKAKELPESKKAEDEKEDGSDTDDKGMDLSTDESKKGKLDEKGKPEDSEDEFVPDLSEHEKEDDLPPLEPEPSSKSAEDSTESIEDSIKDRESDTKPIEDNPADSESVDEFSSDTPHSGGEHGDSGSSPDELDTGRETSTTESSETPSSEETPLSETSSGSGDGDGGETLTDEDMKELDAPDAPETLSTEDVTKDMISDEIKMVSKFDYKPYSRINDFMGPLEQAEEFIRKSPKSIGGSNWRSSNPDHYVFNEKIGLVLFRKYIEPMLTTKSKTLAKDLERVIASKNRVQKVNGLRKGRINSSSLWKITCPSINDDRVFSKKLDHRAVNAAVQLVVDLSGSMDGRRIYLALASAYALSDALDKIKVPNIITGFTTVGMFDNADSASRYEPLFMPILKNWNEKVNSTTCMARLGFVCDRLPLANNADGECILALSQHHNGRTEDKQIMFVLSDGAPCAAGSGFSNHLLDVVDFITKKTNIDILAVGIQTEAPARFYRHHTSVTSVDDLPKTVITSIRDLLLGKFTGF
ncbi:cobaltochelatase CobT-related protein [Providencia sp. PROV145]|uniref:cobaltochelatase CobT-related protein n=1 Tax=Providencia sp. PROV145 TaxID=2949855 RepID=UPI00234907A5|nr:porphyrin biosynthesis protein [Providencia sp. PROV145]